MPTPVSSQPSPPLGDVNCDSVRDIIDALVIAQWDARVRDDVASCPLGDPTQQLNASVGDLDRSDTVDIIDALLVAQCVAGVVNFGCPSQMIEVQQPLLPVEPWIGVDGFVPIAVGDRTYAIERAGNRIGCVESNGVQCWTPRSLLPADAIGTTMAVTRSALVGDKIYFLIREGGLGVLPSTGTLRLACWNTATDGLCPESIDLPGSVSAALHIDVGAAEAYVFDERRSAHCITLATMQRCPGYELGIATALLTEPEWRSGESTTAWYSDTIADGDRVYATLSDGGTVWLHCWDAAIAAPCAGFDPSTLNDTRFISLDNATAGRLFFHRSSSGEVTAVCSQGARNGVDCRSLTTGAPDSAAALGLAATLGQVEYGTGDLGVSTYHPETNRQLFVSTTDVSTTYCHDFDTGSYCGSAIDFVDGVATAPYGYLSIDDCAASLGAAGYITVLAPRWMSTECSGPIVATEVQPCNCPDRWPQLLAVDTDGLLELTVEVFSGDFERLEVIDALATDRFDLNDVAGNEPRLQLVIVGVAQPGEDPWADGAPPAILLG